MAVESRGRRWELEMKRGLIQLLLLRLLDAESYGYQLARQMAERGVPGDERTLYPMLRRMERQGLLRSSWSRVGRRPWRYYAITDEGRRLREELLEAWSRLGLALGGWDAVGEAAGEPPVGEVAARLVETLEEERREIERLRSDLLSTVSHELRTPLTLIRTSIGLLLDSSPDPPMRDRLLRNIKQSSDRMHSLVTDILDLVRFRSGRAELQLCYLDLGEPVEGAANLMRPLMDEKEQRLELDLPSRPPGVVGDHRRLEQVLLNLLSNANKFAPKGAGIRISVADEDDRVVVAVADTGPGVAPEAQARLFEQFYTGRTSSPSHNIGAGLGLPIARGIVQAHGGEIWVESERGVGTCVYFSLPKKYPATEGSGEDTGGG